MADVRSMLKTSREARRINHPHASYTSNGKLVCNLCETSIKTESAWQSHLHSSNHTLRVTRAQEARETNGASKKRKASTLEEEEEGNTASRVVERKKVEGVALTQEAEAIVSQPPSEIISPHKTIGKQPEEEEEPDPATAAAAAAELAALDKELAEMEAAMPPPQPAITASAPTISAPAISAEEIAAQAREEQSSQRGRRDLEAEAEREDAARTLEDEFEEMEGLEQRVKKLRERREALRMGEGGDVETEKDDGDPIGTNAPARTEQIVEGASDDDDEDEDYDIWNFGRT